MEYAFKQKTWRPPGESDDSSDEDAPKKTKSKSNFGSEAGSSSVKGSAGGKGAKDEPKAITANDGLGNTHMTMMLSDLNATRQKLSERVGKASPKKRKSKRKRTKSAGDDQSVYSVATTA